MLAIDLSLCGRYLQLGVRVCLTLTSAVQGLGGRGYLPLVLTRLTSNTHVLYHLQYPRSLPSILTLFTLNTRANNLQYSRY